MSVLDEDELRALMADLESDRVERTTSITNKTRDKLCRAICSFSNDFPGYGLPGFLLIGVDDDGRASGLRVTDDTLLKLGGLRTDGLVQPMPMMVVDKVTLPEGDVAVVKVLPSDMPPVRYDGRIHIRVGPRRAVATEQEERILVERRVSATRSFDLMPCMGATLDDLAIEIFTSYRSRTISLDTIQQNHRPIEQQLAALRFFDPRRGAPTHAGLLLFGKDPRAWLPGAYVQFLRVDGTSLADGIIDEQEVDGDLLAVLKHLDIITSTLIHQRPVAVPGSVLREQTARSYPPNALRELLVNAIMHRNYQSNGPVRYYWYGDRVEIQSPGGLYGEVNTDNFPNRMIHRITEEHELDVVLCDLGASLGPFCHATAAAVDAIVVPLAPRAAEDAAIRSLAQALERWRAAPSHSSPLDPFPTLGFVIVRSSGAIEIGLEQLAAAYHRELSGEHLGTIKEFPSLANIARNVHKPEIDLTMADGAVGSLASAVIDLRRQYEALATQIVITSHVIDMKKLVIDVTRELRFAQRGVLAAKIGQPAVFLKEVRDVDLEVIEVRRGGLGVIGSANIEADLPDDDDHFNSCFPFRFEIDLDRSHGSVSVIHWLEIGPRRAYAIAAL